MIWLSQTRARSPRAIPKGVQARSTSCAGTAPAQQGLARLPLGRWLQRLEELHLAAREQRDRQAVAVEHAVAGERRRASGPGVRMPTRLSGSAPDSETQVVRGRLAPRLAQRADRIRQRELLAGEARDEPAAADLAARLEPAIDAQQVAPRRQPVGLALEQAPEHDAVAEQQSARDVLDRLGPALRPGWRRPGPVRERPAARILHAEQQRRGAGAAAGAGPRRSDGTSSARSPPKLSEVTRPSATSSASASSTWARNRPVPSTSSSKNDAPCCADAVDDRLRPRGSGRTAVRRWRQRRPERGMAARAAA